MKTEKETTKQGKRNDSQNDNPRKKGIVGDVSASNNATIQDHHDAYFAWWKRQWEMMDIL